MASVRVECPHCGKMDRLSISKPLEHSSVSVRNPWLYNVPYGSHFDDVTCAMRCHLCGGWSIGVFSINPGGGPDFLNGGSAEAKPIESSRLVELLATFPRSTLVLVPEEVPTAAAEFYIEADEDLRAGRRAAGVISKCRSVLDLCLKDLNAVGKGRKARISDLRAKGLLTEGLANWAEELWDDGNDAIHDLTGDPEKAKQHVEFLGLFFQVAFQLPAQVEAAKGPKKEAAERPG